MTSLPDLVWFAVPLRRPFYNSAYHLASEFRKGPQPWKGCEPPWSVSWSSFLGWLEDNWSRTQAQMRLQSSSRTKGISSSPYWGYASASAAQLSTPSPPTTMIGGSLWPIANSIICSPVQFGTRWPFGYLATAAPATRGREDDAGHSAEVGCVGFAFSVIKKLDPSSPQFALSMGSFSFFFLKVVSLVTGSFLSLIYSGVLVTDSCWMSGSWHHASFRNLGSLFAGCSFPALRAVHFVHLSGGILFSTHAWAPLLKTDFRDQHL